MNLDNHQQENRAGLMGKIKLFFKRDYFQNRIVLWLLVISLLGNIVNWVIFGIFIRPNDSNIILHYNVYFGVDVMGQWKLVFLLPAIGLALFLINLVLSIHFYTRKERIASHLLLMASLMAQLSLLIASISVILINY